MMKAEPEWLDKFLEGQREIRLREAAVVFFGGDVEKEDAPVGEGVDVTRLQGPL